MLDLIDSLRRDAVGPTLFATPHLNRELWLQYSAPNGDSVMITVTIDHPDYAPLENGLPSFHYRLSRTIQDSNKANLLQNVIR